MKQVASTRNIRCKTDGCNNEKGINRFPLYSRSRDIGTNREGRMYYSSYCSDCDNELTQESIKGKEEERRLYRREYYRINKR